MIPRKLFTQEIYETRPEFQLPYQEIQLYPLNLALVHAIKILIINNAYPLFSFLNKLVGSFVFELKQTDLHQWYRQGSHYFIIIIVIRSYRSRFFQLVASFVCPLSGGLSTLLAVSVTLVLCWITSLQILSFRKTSSITR